MEWIATIEVIWRMYLHIVFANQEVITEEYRYIQIGLSREVEYMPYTENCNVTRPTPSTFIFFLCSN